jgi:aspartokinase
MTHSPSKPQTTPLSFERGRGVYQFEIIRNLAHVVVKVGEGADRSDLIMRLLRILADAEVPIFLIKLHRTAVTFAVEHRFMTQTEHCLREIPGGYASRSDLVMVTLVAASMRDLNDIAVNIADSLQRAGTRLLGIGDSHNTVQCLIEAGHLDATLRQLGATFHIDKSAWLESSLENGKEKPDA